MYKAKRKWHCPHCSQDSSRHWNLKVHIKRWHNGIGEPIDDEQAKEFKNRTSSQFFSYNQPYSLNDLPRGSLGKEKKPDIIDELYQIVNENKEKLRKIMEIKGFFNELSSLSSSARPVITSGLSQTPIIEPIIPSPVTTTMPLQPTLAPAPQQQEQKEESINLGTALVVNLFITSTILAQDFHKNERGKAKDSIIPREPSLSPPVNTANSDNNNNNNDSKKGEEQQQLKEDSHNMEQYPSSRFNLPIDNENDDAEKWLKKKDIHNYINDKYKVIIGPLLVAKGYYFEVKRKAAEKWKQNNKKKESIIRRIREGKSILLKKSMDNLI